MSFWDGADHGDSIDSCRYFLQTVREQVAVKPMGRMEKIMADLKKQKEGNFDFNYHNR